MAGGSVTDSLGTEGEEGVERESRKIGVQWQEVEGSIIC